MFYSKGVPLCIRHINESDLDNSFYSAMMVLPKDIIERINTLSREQLHDTFNDTKVFVIYNLNTDNIVASATIHILNNHSLCPVCIIKDIIIHKEYDNEKIHSRFMDFLKQYCTITVKCIKIIIK